MPIDEVKPRARIRPAAVAPAPAAQGAPPAAAPRSSDNWLHTGGDARRIAEAELKKQAESRERRAAGVGFMPFRFFLKQGEQREIIILDDDLGVNFYEHHLKNHHTGKWDIYESCPKEFDNCAVCAREKKDSYYVKMLTIIDMTPYAKQDGTVIQFSRKLLPVKAAQQGFFQRTFDREGTLRGVHLLMARDGDGSTQIGTPEFTARYDDAAIIESFGGPAVLDEQGKVLKPENADTKVFPYAMLFKKPDPADLRRRYGAPPQPGSREELAGAWGEGAAAPKRSASSLIQRRAPVEPAETVNTSTGQGGWEPSGSDLDDEIPF